MFLLTYLLYCNVSIWPFVWCQDMQGGGRYLDLIVIWLWRVLTQSLWWDKRVVYGVAPACLPPSVASRGTWLGRYLLHNAVKHNGRRAIWLSPLWERSPSAVIHDWSQMCLPLAEAAANSEEGFSGFTRFFSTWPFSAFWPLCVDWVEPFPGPLLFCSILLSFIERLAGLSKPWPTNWPLPQLGRKKR